MKRLVATNSLKIDWMLNQYLLGKPIEYKYEKLVDALMIGIFPDDSTIVHYLNDEHLALMYREDDRQIVGIRIEDLCQTATR